MFDIPHGEKGQPTVANMPDAPDGMEIVNVDIIVRLRRKGQ